LVDKLANKLKVCDLSETENTTLIENDKIVYIYIVVAKISRRLFNLSNLD